MPLSADAVILPAILAAIIVGVLAYIAFQRRQETNRKRRTSAVRAVIVDYFKRSGVAVNVECMPAGNESYTVLIESEPMKRFRLSHIIEMTLRDYVSRAIGADLDKVYWRFPVKEAIKAAVVPGTAETQAAGEPDKPAAADELSDDYISEGIEHYRHIPKPEVNELPWEAFEEVATSLRKDKPDAS